MKRYTVAIAFFLFLGGFDIQVMAQNLGAELKEYFYPSSSYPHLYFCSSNDINATTTMVMEYMTQGNILNEVITIGPRMETKEDLFSYRMRGGKMIDIKEDAIFFYVIGEWRLFMGVQSNSCITTTIEGKQVDGHVLFILPSGSGLTKWMETVEGEIYTCTAEFTDISFWKDGEKLQRKAVKISKSTRLDNGKEVKEWSYWVKGLSRLATYGYWGDPSQTSCIERSLKIDNKPIIEVSKK